LTSSFNDQLSAEREHLALIAGGGIAAPAAGAIYWAALSVLGLYASPTTWCLVAFVTTGLLFPLALLLQRPTRSNITVKESPVAGAGMVGFVNVAVGWAITIPAFHTNPQLVPLTLGIGMSLHFVSIGWSYGSRVLMFHPLVRALVLVVLWYGLPAHRFTLMPLAVALIYLVTIALLRRELSSFRQRANTSQPPDADSLRSR
jgi:hypothetical protein